jgi:hypothetical protein
MQLRLPVLISLLLGSSTVSLAQQARQSPFDVRLGVQIRPDTVTVGQRFIVVVRVGAPPGSIVRFPESLDSAAQSSTLAPALIGQPVVDSAVIGGSLIHSAAYRIAAWDVGPQSLGLPAIAVEYNGRTGYVSLAAQRVFVRSVLPADTTLWKPKPARPPMQLPTIDWRPLIALLVALAVAGLLWWAWRAWKRRRNRPLPPFEAAEREFARVEAMGLIAGGDPDRYLALMTDVMRKYLAARVDQIIPSNTSTELLRAAAPIQHAASGLDDLLTRADLVKFARGHVTGAEATDLGARARSIVRSVEDHFIALEHEATEIRKAA